MSAFALLADLDDENGFVESDNDEWTTVEQTKKPAAKKQQAAKPAAVPARSQAQARGASTVQTAAQPVRPAVNRPATQAAYTQNYQAKPATHDSSGKPLSDDYYRAFQRCYLNKNTGEVCLRFHKTDVVKVRPNGDVVLNSNSYYTRTTQLSMNDALQFIGFEVKEQGDVSKGHWLVQGPDRVSVKYVDNAVVIHGTQASHKDRGRLVIEGMKELLKQNQIDDGGPHYAQHRGQAPSGPAYRPQQQQHQGQQSMQQQQQHLGWPAVSQPAAAAPASAAAPGPSSQAVQSLAPAIPGAVFAAPAAVPWAGGVGVSYAERMKQRQQQVHGYQAGSVGSSGGGASTSGGGAAGSSQGAQAESATFASRNAALTADDFAAFLAPAGGSSGNLASAGAVSAAGVSPASPAPPAHAYDDDDMLCTVCLEHPRETILIPCSHAVLCQPCADALMGRQGVEPSCPVCRTVVEFVLNIDG